jgi:hypothetical protein
MVESFLALERDIPLEGVAGVTGSIRVRFKWEPQLLLRRKTHTTFMGTTRRMTTRMGTTAFNFSQPPKNTASVLPPVPPLSTPAAEKLTTTRSIGAKLANIVETKKELPLTHQQQEHDFVVKIRPGTITVHIIEARGLKEDKLNPQVIVYIGKQQLLKTKKLKKTVTPFWDEQGSLYLNGEETNIEIRIKDAHTFHSNDIGYWNSSLWDLIRPPIVNSLDKWLPLEPEGSGEVHVQIDYSE